jgi:hypothetical protein
VAAAPDVNALEQGGWAKAGVIAAPAASDEEFLRRVTLDLVGRVPTVDEARAFLGDAAADKREKLVDRLLASPDYAEHWADVYGDLLWGRDARLRGPYARLDRPRAYLVDAFAGDRPWDQVAAELIGSSGELAQDGKVSYVAAHIAKGQDAAGAAGATARIFLGLSIQCAQCHDHPYDKRWKQADFIAFAAFFAETRAKIEKQDAGPPRLLVFDQPLPKAITDDGPRGERVRARISARLKQKGRELPPWALVEPRFLGRDVPAKHGETRRQTLARAIVGSPLFARVTVNRTWAAFFGAGVVDPWDDLGGEDEPQPALLERLAADFAGSGYSMKKLVREIVLSDAYARSSTGANDDGKAAAVFARARVRPLSADQLFRSLVTATAIERAARGRFKADVGSARERALKEYLFVFPDDEAGETDKFSGSVAQMLLLLNGEVVNDGAMALPGATLGDALAASTDPEARLDTLFLAAYARKPRPDESKALLAYVVAQGGTKEAWEDVFFALLTSTEFTTNH